MVNKLSRKEFNKFLLELDFVELMQANNIQEFSSSIYDNKGRLFRIQSCFSHKSGLCVRTICDVDEKGNETDYAWELYQYDNSMNKHTAFGSDSAPTEIQLQSIIELCTPTFTYVRSKV